MPNRVSAAAQIRIGKMKGADIEFSDDLDAPLYSQIDMAVGLLKTKYSKSPVTYDGMARIDNHPYPYDALREAILNAVINTEYGSHIPVKILVFEDHLEVLNCGGLPFGMELEDIIRDHWSSPRNRGIATVFKTAHYIEKYGRGFEKMNRSYEGRASHRLRTIRQRQVSAPSSQTSSSPKASSPGTSTGSR
ncbi:MAG: hypothetical protein LBS92_04040 [Candidatus Methanoplasma sp.]|nr:hypothetical protein [Candidatus Methanoplasma sp.]